MEPGSPTDECRRYLGVIPCFSSIPEEEVGRIARGCAESRYAAGGIVFSEGDPGRDFFIVARGEVEIWREHGQPEGELLEIYGPGGMFGEMALIDDRPRCATVVAREPVRLIRIDRDDFFGAIESSTRVSMAIMRSITAKIRSSNDRYVAKLRDRNRCLKEEIAAMTRTQDALRRTEARFQRVVENMEVMIDAFDADGVLCFWNKECERVTGYTAAEMVGNPRALEMLYPDAGYRREMLEKWRAHPGVHRSWRWETTCKDGGRKTISWSNITPQCPVDGWADWGMGKDITRYISSQEKLRRAQEDLENRVALRTAELKLMNEALKGEIAEREAAESALRRKQAQLVHAGRLTALGEMAGGVAHELNQPLSVIRIHAHQIRKAGRRSHDPEVEGDAAGIIRQVDRAALIIDQMRGFSRGIDGPPRPMDPGEALDNSLVFFRQQFYNHEIDLAIRRGEDLPRVAVPASRFEQIVVNFLSNARHAVEKRQETRDGHGPKSVEIRLFREADAVVLEVADNGAGMAPSVLDRCLEPFFTTKPVGEGTGLGLSIVHGILRDCGGKLIMESREGKGTTVRAEIPAAETGTPEGGRG